MNCFKEFDKKRLDDEAKNEIAISTRKRNQSVDTNVFFAGGFDLAALRSSLSISLTPNHGWVLASIDKNGKVRFIAEKIPSRSLAEKAMGWFEIGLYRKQLRNSWLMFQTIKI